MVRVIILGRGPETGSQLTDLNLPAVDDDARRQALQIAAASALAQPADQPVDEGA